MPAHKKSEELRAKPLSLSFPPALIQEIQDWMLGNRKFKFSTAVQELVAEGLKAKGASK